MDTLIYIDDAERHNASASAKTFTNIDTRKRAYINTLGAELAIKYLKSENIDVSSLQNIHSIRKILEEIDISDIILSNIHIDVRTVFDENAIFIPKSHFDLNLLPDIYVVFELAKDESCVKFLGFFEPQIINKNNQNNEYYFIEKEKLNPASDLIKYIESHNFKTEENLSEEKLELYEMSIISMADNDISENDKKNLIEQLGKSNKLREKFIEFENFEVLSSRAMYDKQIEKPELPQDTEIKDEFDEFGEFSDENYEIHEDEPLNVNDEILSEDIPDDGIIETLTETGLAASALGSAGFAATAANVVEAINKSKNIDEDIFDTDNMNISEENINENITEPLNDIPDDIVDKNIAEPLTDISEDVVDENITEPLNDIVEESIDENIAEPLTEISEDVVDENITEPLNDIVEESIDENITEPLTEISEDVVDENIEDINLENITEPLTDENIIENVDIPMISDISDNIENIQEPSIDTNESTEDVVNISDENVSLENNENILSTSDNIIENISEPLDDINNGINDIEINDEQDEFDEIEFNESFDDEYQNTNNQNDNSNTVSFEELAKRNEMKNLAELQPTDYESLTSNIFEEQNENSINNEEENESFGKNLIENLNAEEMDNVLIENEQKNDYTEEVNHIFENTESNEENNRSVSEELPQETTLKQTEQTENSDEEPLPDDLLIADIIKNANLDDNGENRLNVLYNEDSSNTTQISNLEENIDTEQPIPGQAVVQNVQSKKNIIVAAALLTILAGMGIFTIIKQKSPSVTADNEISETYTNQNVTGENILADNIPDIPQTPVTKTNVKELKSTIPAQAPRKSTAYMSVSKLVWDVPDDLSYSNKMQNYLRTAGKSIKLSLSTDLLLANEYAYTNQLKIGLILNKNGSIKDTKIVSSSGSSQIDKIVLQSVKDTLNVVKPPTDVINTPDFNLNLIIYF